MSQEERQETLQGMFERAMGTLSPVLSKMPNEIKMEEYMRSMKDTWISLIHSHLSNQEVETLCQAFVILSNIEESKIVNFNEEFATIAMSRAEEYL